MGDIRKIEKELFKNNPDHCGKNNGRQHDGTKGKNKEVRTGSLPQGQTEWINVEMEKEKENRDDFWFKILVAGLVIISPFIIIYELTESLWFKGCPRKRKDEYRNMMQGRVAEAGKTRPDRFDLDYFRNSNRTILYFNSSQAMYPTCEVILYIPEEKAAEYDKVPWEDKRTLHSVRVPNTFHSYWAEGNVSDLVEHGWLRKFQQDYHLTRAVPVINYAFRNPEESIWYKRSFYKCIICSWEEEKKPVECFVELLSKDEPIKGTDWAPVSYRYCSLGMFTLERGCFDQLTDRSRRRLERILEEYGVNI